MYYVGLHKDAAQMVKSPHVLTMTEPVVILLQLTSNKSYTSEQ